MARVLVDAAVLDGLSASFPLAWLSDMELLPFAPRALTAQTPGVASADALLVRTVTKVDAGMLAALPALRAVATLSSGTDHLDLDALERRGIALHTGHGGNAQAVADWVAWVLDRLREQLQGTRVLVVGVGAVGTAVADRLEELGFEPVLCDPPRALREPDFPARTLDQALSDGPYAAVTLHVPKISAGPFATAGMMDRERLERVGHAVLLNAARGGVVDEAAATVLRRNGQLGGLAVDTFVGEPCPASDFIAAADLVTPHIGGHSVEGKLRVAHLAVSGLRATLGLPPIEAWQAACARIVASWGVADWRADVQLDAADRALRAHPERFEAIRHAHRRRADDLR